MMPRLPMLTVTASRICFATMVLLMSLAAPLESVASTPLDEAVESADQLTGFPKGGGTNLEIGSILLRTADGDSGSAPVIHNPGAGQSLRPQIYYDASDLPADPVHFIRFRLNGQSVCEGEITTDNGIRRVTCPATTIPSGSFTIDVEIDVNNQIAESDEADNRASRTYNTAVNDPLDLDAVFVGLVDVNDNPVATVLPGDEVFIDFVFDVEQAINYYWRAELRMNGERVCGFFNFRPDPDGSRRDVSCSTSITVPSGPFTISGVADYRFEQSETSESNNEAIATIMPSLPPDPEEVRVDVLQLPFFCCAAPPPATQLGAVVSSNGKFTAVGEPFFFDGRIATFTVLNGVPFFDDLVFAPEGFRVDNFGSAVAVSSDIMVVGAPVFDPVPAAEKAGLSRLKAALFERVNQGWEFKLPIDPGNSQEDDQFGFSVDIDGSTIVIGAPSDAEGEATGQGSGAVYLFEYDGNSVSMVDKVKPAAAQGGQAFGAAVAVKGARIAVGSPSSSIGSAVTGSASLYDLVGNNLNGLGTVTGSGSGDGDRFGITIDLSGDMLVVGAPENDAAGANVGAAYVFDVSGDLKQMGRLMPNDPVPNARFGSAVSTDGIASVVGAPGGVSEVGNNGAIYRFMGTAVDLKIPSPDGLETPLQGFGASIDLAGSRLAVGAPETNQDNGGAAMVSGLPDTSYSGPWFNAQQSGHGWFIEHLADASGESINAYWYVYLDGQAVWLVGQGPLIGTSAQLQVFITDGGRFPPAFSSNDVNLQPWGTLNFDFTTPTSGSASWSSSVPGFSSGSLQMEKIARVPGTSLACRSGSYYNAQQSGHGFVVQVLDVDGSEQALVAWYVYDSNGEQVWLIGQGPIANNEVNLTLFRFAGADFPPAFTTQDVVNTAWGSLRLRFTDNDTATANWTSQTSGFASGSLNLVRLTTLKGRGC